MPERIEIYYADPRGTVKVVTLDNGEIWDLTGECNRCGQCCEQTEMPVPEFKNPDGSCKKYSREIENGQDLGKCNIMWGRPYFCAVYPRHPHETLHEKCSFKWERRK